MKRKPDERFQPGEPPDRPQSAEDRIFDMQATEPVFDDVELVDDVESLVNRDRAIETAIYAVFALIVAPPLLFFVLLYLALGRSFGGLAR